MILNTKLLMLKNMAFLLFNLNEDACMRHYQLVGAPIDPD